MVLRMCGCGHCSDRRHKGCYGKMVDHKMEKEGRIGQ